MTTILRRMPALVACAWLCGCASEPPKHLLIVSLDTTRRDHLPTYGYERDTAPALDGLARQSVVFDEAYSQDTNTNPSHASMFTGLYPHTHGSRRNGVLLPEDRVTLAQTLHDAGFRTGAFVSGVTLQRSVCALERGFDVYDDRFEGQRRDGAQTTAAALDWLGRRSADERWFLFLHLFDAHGPYRPEGDYRSRFHSADPGPEIEVPGYQSVRDDQGRVLRGLNGYVDRYDAMIRYVDDRLAVLLERIDYERTVVVILADHGETLGERFHKLNHGAQLFDEQVRIPLIIRAPGFSARRVTPLVETTDLLPTVLELLDVQPTAASSPQGRSLVALMRGNTAGSREFVFSSARASSRRHADRGYRLDRSRRLHSIRSARFKLIVYPGERQDYLELFDLSADSAERKDVAGQFPDVRDDLFRRLHAWLGEERAVPERPIDPQMMEKLRDLGYVGG